MIRNWMIKRLGGYTKQDHFQALMDQSDNHIVKEEVFKRFISEYHKQLMFLHKEREKAKTPIERVLARDAFESFLEKNVREMFSDFKLKWRAAEPPFYWLERDTRPDEGNQP